MSPDVVIVGAGPAGMSAAMALRDCGAEVMVVDEQAASGGQVFRSVNKTVRERHSNLHLLGKDYARGEQLSRGFDTSGAEFVVSTSVWDLGGGADGPRISIANSAGSRTLHPRHVILATGAMERPTPFPGWTLPGVMGVGAAQTLFKESGLVPDKRFVVAGSGPLLYLFTVQLLAAGARPEVLLDASSRFVPATHWPALLQAFVADTKPLRKGLAWLGRLRRAGIHHLHGLNRLEAEGGQQLERVLFSAAGDSGEIESDLLLVHDGVIPNTHLAMAAGCVHNWNNVQNYWAPRLDQNNASSVNGISIVGDAAGILGADAAMLAGRMTGFRVAHKLDLIDESHLETKVDKLRTALMKQRTLRRFLDRCYQPLPWFQQPSAQTVVCRCEQITAGEIRQATEMGAMGPNQLKAFTRCGMGPCLGRLCGNTVSRICADVSGRPVSEVGHYNIRPPVRPITVEQLMQTQTDQSA